MTSPQELIAELAARRFATEIPAAEALRIALARIDLELDEAEARLRRKREADVLHGYRVLLRSSRALLSGLGHLAPSDLAERFATPLAELGRRGSEARDLDVWLEGFDDLARDDTGALEPLRRRLSQARDEAWAAFRAGLDTAGYRRLREDWRNSLLGDWSAAGEIMDEPTISEALADVLEERVGRFRKRASKLDAGSGAVLFHDQRKRAKKIRYLFQHFAEMLDAAPRDRFLKTLRRIQDALGQLQDLATETGALHRFGREWADELGAACLMAMGALGGEIMRREQGLRAVCLKRMRAFESNRNRRDFDAILETLSATRPSD